MASKKASKILQGRTGQSIVERLERAVSTVANAASVAATGSEIGVLERAIEDDVGVRQAKKPARKTAARKPAARKTAARKTAARKTAAKKATKKAAKKATRSILRWRSHTPRWVWRSRITSLIFRERKRNFARRLN